MDFIKKSFEDIGNLLNQDKSNLINLIKCIGLQDL